MQELYFPLKHKNRQPSDQDPRPTPMPDKPRGAGGTRRVFPRRQTKRAAWPLRRVTWEDGAGGGFVVPDAPMGHAASRVKHQEMQYGGSVLLAWGRLR